MANNSRLEIVITIQHPVASEYPFVRATNPLTSEHHGDL